jgi:hypothetical protein
MSVDISGIRGQIYRYRGFQLPRGESGCNVQADKVRCMKS